MHYKKGFATITILAGILGIIVLGSAGYIAMNPDSVAMFRGEAPIDDHADHEHEEGEETNTRSDSEIPIEWHFTDAGEVEGIPYTNVAVYINGGINEMGTFEGSCSELGASGGVDGKGLLAGELSAVQCWFGGGGNEIGVFAHEDGGVDLMVGELSEGDENSGLFRGDFTVKNSIVF